LQWIERIAVGPIYRTLARARPARDCLSYLMSARGSVDQNGEWIAGFISAI